MSRYGSIRRADGRTARLASMLALAIVGGLGSAPATYAQEPAAPPASAPVPPAAPPAPVAAAPTSAESQPATPLPTPAPGVAAPLVVAPETFAPGTAVVGAPVLAPAAPSIPENVQVVRFQGPEGVVVEVLGPSPDPVPTGDGHGLLTAGLRVGTPYRLRLTNLPDKPGVEIFPVVEVVGHLHRPAGIDPGKYPIRVVFSLEDIDDVIDRARLVTQVIYLEDPENALPIKLPKDQIPVVGLNPSEDPLKVGAALGRVMVIVRMGGRKPTPEEVQLSAFTVTGGPAIGGHCPFTQATGDPCAVPCGPVCGTPPPRGTKWLPKDEYLCDGGDHKDPARFGGDGGLAGIDPRDAVIRFDDGRRPRALPTNTVCIYAPRFAEVRTSVGANESIKVDIPVRTKFVQKETVEAARQELLRFVKNESAELARMRERASGLGARQLTGQNNTVQVPSGYNQANHIAGAIQEEHPQLERLRQKPQKFRERQKGIGIKTAESAIITGITEGAGQMVMTWPARETVGVETPPNRPGMAVIKRVSATEAEAGDKVEYVIQFRNMGNTPIRDVTIVDSLLPRLEYVKGSAKGPKGSTFTADDNRAGSTELKWVLPEPLRPGVEGYVSFEAVVR